MRQSIQAMRARRAISIQGILRDSALLFAHCAMLFLASISALALSSCSTRMTVEVSAQRLDAFAESEYAESVHDFADSLESVLDAEVDLETERFSYWSISTDELEAMAGSEGLDKIITISTESDMTANESADADANPSCGKPDAAKTFSFCIDQDNYEALEAIFPIIGEEKVKTYLADYNRDMDEDEYLEMIDFVFGEEAARDLKDSFVTLFFFSEDGFESFEGLERENDNTLRTGFRLLDFLLLKNPISFSFSAVLENGISKSG